MFLVDQVTLYNILHEVFGTTEQRSRCAFESKLPPYTCDIHTNEEIVPCNGQKGEDMKTLED